MQHARVCPARSCACVLTSCNLESIKKCILGSTDFLKAASTRSFVRRERVATVDGYQICVKMVSRNVTRRAYCLYAKIWYTGTWMLATLPSGRASIRTGK